MTIETRNILVGTLVVVIGALFLVFSSRGGVEDNKPGYELNAVYQSVDGVSVGTDVLLAGIKVGEVTGLDYLANGHRASLTMRIDKGVPLPIDSVAMIISSGMLGGKYIKLEPGGEEETFESGGYFEYVQGAIIFEELLQKIVLDAEGRRLKAREEAKAGTPSSPVKAKDSPFGSLLK